METFDRVVDDIAKGRQRPIPFATYALTDDNGKRAMQLALTKGLSSGVTGDGQSVLASDEQSCAKPQA